jgi:5-methylcytosine-specific restriction endonuclease McrA
VSPWAPRKPCSMPGCLRLRPCPEHGVDPRVNRPTRLPHFYNTAPWRRLRKQVLAEQSLCEWSGCATASLDVAHIIPRRQRPDLALDRSNVRALCHRHHSSETASRESWHRK